MWLQQIRSASKTAWQAQQDCLAGHPGARGLGSDEGLPYAEDLSAGSIGDITVQYSARQGVCRAKQGFLGQEYTARGNSP